MAFELREGQGSLFKNDRKTSDSHPNARGEALIGGVLYEVAAWTREGRNGKYQSLSFKPKQARQTETRDKMMDNYDAGRQRERDERRELDDEVPF